MKVLCIRYYPYDPGNGIELRYCSYLTGKTYEIIDTIYVESKLWYRVKSDNTIDIFSDEEFKDYFKTPSQMRKDKLQKLEDMRFLGCGD